MQAAWLGRQPLRFLVLDRLYQGQYLNSTLSPLVRLQTVSFMLPNAEVSFISNSHVYGSYYVLSVSDLASRPDS